MCFVGNVLVGSHRSVQEVHIGLPRLNNRSLSLGYGGRESQDSLSTHFRLLFVYPAKFALQKRCAVLELPLCSDGSALGLVIRSAYHKSVTKQ